MLTHCTPAHCTLAILRGRNFIGTVSTNNAHILRPGLTWPEFDLNTMARSLVSFVQIKNLFSCYWAPCQGSIPSGHALSSWPWSICKQSLNRKGTCSSHYILNLGTWVQCSRQFTVTRFHHRKESSFKNPSPAMETEMIKRTALIENGGGEASCDGPVPSDFLLQYHPADWMKQLQLIPKYRVKVSLFRKSFISSL